MGSVNPFHVVVMRQERHDAVEHFRLHDPHVETPTTERADPNVCEESVASGGC